MKIIHCADLHLDSKLESNLSADKAKIRRDELLDTFERLVEFAEQQGVSVIMIAGDMFDKNHIRKLAKNRTLEIMESHPYVTFLYLKGNHDKTDFLSDLEGEIPQNLKTFSDEEWTSYSFGEEDEVVITGREINKNNSKMLATNLILDQSKVNIVMLHGQEANYVGNDKTEVINLNDYKNKYIDYLALGHIHSYKNEKLDERGEYCYSGCLEGRGFDECGDKGFVLLDIHDSVIDSEFIPFAYRKLHEIPVEITPEMDMPAILAAIEGAISAISEKDLVKVVLQGNTDMDFDIDVPRIIRTFEEKFFFFKIYDRTSPEIHYESFVHDRSLKGEFVRLMQKEELSEEERSQIIEIGMKAIMGEDIEE